MCHQTTECIEFSLRLSETRPAPVQVQMNRPVPEGKHPVLFRLDEIGQPMVFDAERSGEESLRVPCRFEPSSAASEGGRLVFVAEGGDTVHYRLEFREADFESPLLGDGDTFRLREGEILLDGTAVPLYQGKRLFGEPGILVASSNDQGCYFFAGNIDEAAPLRFRRVLRDSQGRIIGGFALLLDLNGNGVLDILVCHDDGTIWRYDNTGSDEVPVFVSRGQVFDLIPELQGLTYSVRRPDGSVNPVYPRCAVVCEHGGKRDPGVHLTPFSAQGKKGVLASVRGGFLVYFVIADDGKLDFRGFALDEEGQKLAFDVATAHIVSCDSEQEKPVFFGITFHGRWFTLRLKEFSAEGVPVFCQEMHDEVLTRLTGTSPLLAGNILLLGGQGGCIERFRVSRDENGIRKITRDGNLLRTNAFPGFQALGTAVYADMSGTGRYGLLSGNVRGRLTWYPNIGTRRNPVLAGTGKMFDQMGTELKINQGPDPLEPFDGYTKPIALKMNRQAQRMDILTGSGLGQIYHYRNLGTKDDGTLLLEAAGVLQDTEGNPIGCHHMSALTAAHWFGNEAPDLIVCGQYRVHASPDADADRSQVRVYAGHYEADGRLVFAPYQVIRQGEDVQFEYRPIPPEVTVTPEGETRLRLGWLEFRRPRDAEPNAVELVGEWPFPPAPTGWIPAYAVRSELAPGDEVFIINSCVGSLKVFREAFQRLGGYASCEVTSCSVSGLLESVKKPEYVTKQTIAAMPEKILPETPRVKYQRGQDGKLEMEIWTGDSSPQDMLLNCLADRGPVYDDDRIEVRICRPGKTPLLLMVSAKGCICIYSLPASGLLQAPENASELYRRVSAKTEILHDGWKLSLTMPGDLASSGCRMEVRRCLAHYADVVRALEQRRTLTASAKPIEF